MKKEKVLNFKQIKKKALAHLRSGKWLYGKAGAFAPLFKKIPDTALETEPESNLDTPNAV